MAKKPKTPKAVESLTHGDATRRNIPTAEAQPLVPPAVEKPVPVRYERNRDLDPQLVWRGKDEQDWSELVVQAPPLYIQEKVHPKALIDDLRRRSEAEAKEQVGQFDLFADFNGLPSEAAKTEFYQHDAHWANRMILGDSLQVMASLAEREGLRGKVQCIYFDPPYGIKFNSNFQWSTTNRDVKDGSADHITREPEQVKAFRDTWKDGIHSYLTYLRDRLTVARDLLTESGSIFVQIGDENVHRVRAVMDEVFGADNFVAMVVLTKAATQSSNLLAGVNDYLLWFSRDRGMVKYRPLFQERPPIDNPTHRYICVEDDSGVIHDLSYKQKVGEDEIPPGVFLRMVTLTSQSGGETTRRDCSFRGRRFRPPGTRGWSTNEDGLRKVELAGRMWSVGTTLMWKNYHADYPFRPRVSLWDDIRSSGFGSEKIYVVQTQPEAVQRCLLMATDPGDLVLDPTCGSGTTAYVAEQWGRRWITVDTSRVALALARARIMGARYPYYLLADSREGQVKEAELTRTAPSSQPVRGNIAHGFVYERVPHVTLKSIANNAEIDVIYDDWQPKVQGALERLNAALRGHAKPYKVTAGGREGKDVRFDAAETATFTMPSGEVVPAFALVEWEVPREAPADWPKATQKPLEDFWAARIGRQKEIDASIAARADYEYLYDRPYEDKKKVRVAGPFTVESISPHRILGVGADDELLDGVREAGAGGREQDFVQMILETLRTAGVQQPSKQDKIDFSSITPWPGRSVCAEGRYAEGDAVRRAAIFIGPEFGTVQRADLVQAAREAADGGFDVLIACAFSYEAHAADFTSLGRVPVLRARMNADLHMAEDLKNTGKGNLFVIFGEPDIEIFDAEGEPGHLRVRINGVDVFDPSTGEVRADGPDGIACWFIDTDYNEESFFVRHAYFLGAGDPYKSLKTSLKAEINEDAWATLYSDTSRPFERPKSGRIAVKVINHLGDEVMKVFRV